MSIDLETLISFEKMINDPKEVFALVDKYERVILLKNNAPVYIIVKPKMALDDYPQAAMPTADYKLKTFGYTLQEAMKLILLETEGNQMRAADLADEIYRKGLYFKKDGSKAEYNQIRARCGHYPDMFEALPGNVIKLRTGGISTCEEIVQMKGKRIFTEKEASEIRKLITQKIQAPENKQKSIRDKIRNIGFYYSDFHGNRIEGGYTVEDFNELIETGQIQIMD